MEISKETITTISKELGLKYTGLEQDWDIELANHERIGEFIKAYKNLPNSNKEKRFAIMSLIIASFNDYLEIDENESDKIWLEIKKELSVDKNLFKELIQYWSLREESNDENLFRITYLIRNIDDKKCEN